MEVNVKRLLLAVFKSWFSKPITISGHTIGLNVLDEIYSSINSQQKVEKEIKLVNIIQVM